jgi:hypothetical protein
MSAAEFGRWIDYFNKYGRIGPTRMFDAGAALIAWKVDHVMGGKTLIKDYLPFYSDPEHIATVSEVMKAFGGTKSRG